MNLANQITIARILLVPVFVTAVAYQANGSPSLKWVAVGLFFLASVSDAIDGFIARVRKEQTKLGAVLDPFADKLLLIAAFFSVHFSPSYTLKLPVWVLIIIVSREIFIVSGLVMIFFSHRDVKIKPNLMGKLTTVLQMVTVGTLLLQLHWSNYAAYFAAVLTVISGMGYVWRELKNASHHPA